MAHLYGAMRRYVNHFQPSFKLLEKTRDGATVVKRYSPPATPCDRLMQHDTVNEETKEALRQRRAMLDPVALLHTVREAQSALMAVSSPQLRETPQGESLERFLARLPSLWRQGEARPYSCGPCAGATPMANSQGSLRGRLVRHTGLVCRKTRTPRPVRCWHGCGWPIPADTPTHNCERYSAGCSSGAASWPKNWFMARRMKPSRTRVQCRN